MDILGIVDIPLSWILVIIGFYLLYKYMTWNHNFFVKMGIPGPTPSFLIGNARGTGVFADLNEMSKTYGKIYGLFLGRSPAFVISDTDVLKDVFVKSFDNFRNRRKIDFINYPFNLGVFFLENEAWKRVRTIITPSFTSGKLKKMQSSINDCARVLTKNYNTAIDKDDVDIKSYFGAFTMDVIAQTAFGISVDSQNDFNDPLITNAMQILKPTKSFTYFLMAGGAFPFAIPLLKRIRETFFKQSFVDFFVSTMKDMIKQRQNEPKEKREMRSDFLGLLMNAEIQEKPNNVANGAPAHNMHKRLTTDELIGQGILFFLAGYETTATTLQFAAYSLARYPDTQEKLYREIMEVIGDGEPNTDNLSKLKYMDNVIDETLRLYPPVRALHRRAAENIDLGKVFIPKGMTVFIPVYAMQRDPNIFHHPDEFIPERFDEDIDPLTTLAFGYGPRLCIGKRLALVEAKIALVHVMRRIKFECGPHTPEKLEFQELSGILAPVKPIRLKVSPRMK